MVESAKDPDFLIHDKGDSVGVAVKDMRPGDLRGCYLVGEEVVKHRTEDEIPLGHKVALTDLEEGDDVIEYGVRVGVATKKIVSGDYVHVHNVRSARWVSSVA